MRQTRRSFFLASGGTRAFGAAPSDRVMLGLIGAGGRPAISKTSPKGFGYATDLHVANFLECVRTRKKPTASMALGFQAALVVQLANISLRAGRRAKWNHAAGKVEV